MAGKPGKSGRREAPNTRGSVESVGDLKAPKWLAGEALEKFSELGPVLKSEFGAGALDSDALAMYCHYWAGWVEKRHHHETATAQKYAQHLKDFQRQLGMTFLARAKLPEPKQKEQDAFSEYDPDKIRIADVG